MLRAEHRQQAIALETNARALAFETLRAKGLAATPGRADAGSGHEDYYRLARRSPDGIAAIASDRSESADDGLRRLELPR